MGSLIDGSLQDLDATLTLVKQPPCYFYTHGVNTHIVWDEERDIDFSSCMTYFPEDISGYSPMLCASSKTTTEARDISFDTSSAIFGSRR